MGKATKPPNRFIDDWLYLQEFDLDMKPLTSALIAGKSRLRLTTNPLIAGESWSGLTMSPLIAGESRSGLTMSPLIAGESRSGLTMSPLIAGESRSRVSFVQCNTPRGYQLNIDSSELNISTILIMFSQVYVLQL